MTSFNQMDSVTEEKGAGAAGVVIAFQNCCPHFPPHISWTMG